MSLPPDDARHFIPPALVVRHDLVDVLKRFTRAFDHQAVLDTFPLAKNARTSKDEDPKCHSKQRYPNAFCHGISDTHSFRSSPSFVRRCTYVRLAGAGIKCATTYTPSKHTQRRMRQLNLPRKVWAWLLGSKRRRRGFPSGLPSAVSRWSKRMEKVRALFPNFRLIVARSARTYAQNGGDFMSRFMILRLSTASQELSDKSTGDAIFDLQLRRSGEFVRHAARARLWTWPEACTSTVFAAEQSRKQHVNPNPTLTLEAPLWPFSITTTCS